MFDLIRSIFAAFAGKLRAFPEARKLVWPMIIALFFSGCCIGFVAYVSYSRYLDMAGFLPGAPTIALCFTVGIALFMFFTFAVITTFTVEVWIKRSSRFSWQGIMIFAIAALVVGLVDFQMNMDGVSEVARKSVGSVQEVNEEAIIERYTSSVQPLQAKIAKIMSKYTWKGKTYFKPSKYHPEKEWRQDTLLVHSAQRQITKFENLKIAALQTAREKYNRKVGEKDNQESLTENRLTKAVYGVYFVQFLLALVIAFCAVKMDEALDRNLSPTPYKRGSKNPIGFETGLEVASTSDKNTIQGIKQEIATLKSELQKLREIEGSQAFKNSANSEGIPTRKSTVNLVEALPPDNTGKRYDLTKSQLRQCKRIQKAYDYLLGLEDKLPSQMAIAQRAKVSENTARKYIRMMGLETVGRG